MDADVDAAAPSFPSMSMVMNTPAVRQIDRDEVRLRRTIGLKKDEFSIDRKHVP